MFSRSATSAVDAFLQLLGWQAKDGKAFDFAFEPLGVVCDLRELAHGRVLFSNRPERIDELLSTVDRLSTTGSLDRAVASQLRGRIQFAGGQVYAKVGAVSFALLGKVADKAYASARECRDVS